MQTDQKEGEQLRTRELSSSCISWVISRAEKQTELVERGQMSSCCPLPGVCVQARGINLSCVRTCVVVAEERPRVSLTHSFSKLFKDIGLSSRAVSTTFGSRVNVAICLQVRLPRALGRHWHQVADARLGCVPHSPSVHISEAQHLPCGEQLARDLSSFSHFPLPNRITDAQNK